LCEHDPGVSDGKKAFIPTLNERQSGSEFKRSIAEGSSLSCTVSSTGPALWKGRWDQQHHALISINNSRSV
jgi:hypothetical protein